MERVKWGVLGTARIAVTQVIPALMRAENCVCTAIASRDVEKLQRVGNCFDKRYASYEALLADPEVQAVYIPLPNHLHCEWTIRALRAGKHVLCEKPLATTGEECRRMRAAARENRRLLMEAFMYRHTHKSRLIADIVASGRLGSIRYIQTAYGFDINDPENVRLRQQSGGGALFDMGCYTVNFCNWIAKLTHTELESAHGFFVTRRDMDGGFVDVRCNGQLNYQNGMTATAVSWFDGAPINCAEIVGKTARLRVPYVYTDDPVPLELIWYDYESDPMCKDREMMFMPCEYFRVEQFIPEPSDRYRMEVTEFAAAILEGREPAFTVEESIANMETVEALYGAMTPNEKSPALPRIKRH